MSRKTWLSILPALVAATAGGQTITTVAGNNWSFPTLPLMAVQAPLGQVACVALDAAGNYYIADNENSRVFKVDASGTLTTAAGNGISGFSGDNGPATSASISLVDGLAADASGNLYIADTNNNRIRKVDTNGIITTVAGGGGQGFGGDNGPAASATLFLPQGVAVDGAGDLFISDTLNERVREVNSSGIITTIAGNGTQGYAGDTGPATGASLNYPEGLAVDAAGNVYIADENNEVIREVSAGGIITTMAGNGNSGYSGDNGPATSAELSFPGGVSLDGAGNLYIGDRGNYRIRKVSGGIITTIAGDGAAGYAGDGGLATQSSLNIPQGAAMDALGNLFIADTANSRIRKVDNGGIISTVAGNGGYRYAGDGGPAASAVLNSPQGVAADGFGNYFIADTFNDRVRMVNGDQIISTVAGNGVPAYSGASGAATNVSLYFPAGVAMDTSGNLFIADGGNNVIRKVTPGGVMTTVAGNGSPGFSGDNGPATSARLNNPTGVALDNSGNLFIVEPGDVCVVREVNTAGIITTVAGSVTCGYSGDGGLATSAELNYPTAIAVDKSGNLYIADSANNAVRKVTAGIISTVAGNGHCAYSGDNGPAASAALCFPWGVAADQSGNLFIADTSNGVVREVNLNGTITTVAGNGIPGYSGDNGPATSASVAPHGVAVDTECNLYIADANVRIRKVVGISLSVNPAVVFLDSTAQSGTAVTVTAPGSSCAWASAGSMPWISVISGASGTGNGMVTYSVQANSTGAVRTGTLNIGTETVSITQRETSEIFADVTPSDYYFDFAGLMYGANITAGCSTNPPDYCPDAATTRAEMAVFLIAAIEGSSIFTYTTTPYFTDVPASSPYFKFVQKLKDLGITGGCSATQYCPNDPVTRGEMAVLVIQSRYGGISFTYPSTPYFSDVPASNAIFPFVQKLAQAGITAGCGAGLYCPDQTLTRGQMSVFMVTGLLNELLPTGTPIIATAAPNTAGAGQAVTVTLTGVNTHFVEGTTQVTAAPGITASNITVTSATSLTAQLTIGSSVPAGPTTIVAITRTEEAVLPNGFAIQSR